MKFMEKQNERTILVTGGAGFIGSHLCERLAKEGRRVISLDNYFSGSKENHVAGVEYREGHTKDTEQHVPEQVDIIYHLGEYARVAKSMEEPETVFALNMLGTLGVLEFWRKRKCKLVYAGSSTKQADERADGVLGRNLSPYTLAKAANSDLVANYGRWYGLSYVITYFYNVYGPRERSADERGTFIGTCCQNYVHSTPYKIALPGTQTRAFTHVADTVDGILLVGERGESDEYGISAKEVYSLLDVANMFGGQIAMLPQTKSTRSTGATDTSKIEALGWKQKHKLEEYVREVKEKCG
jgi:UDP-glucose 4-epimerase